LNDIVSLHPDMKTADPSPVGRSIWLAWPGGAA
jgi:hypothetical protein